MIVFKEEFSKKLNLFEESLDQAKFISIDCEMTGVTSDISTDGTKYDTAEIRYHKQKKIAQTFGLIQIGITCYIEKKKDDIQYYLERTFTFYLFKNSKLGWLCQQYPNESKFNIFNSFLNCHPLSMKFLSDNGFDFNLILSKGIHFNKIEYKDKIKDILEEHVLNGNLPNSVVYLSKKSEESVLDFTKYLASIIKGDETKKNFQYDQIKEDFLINYVLGVNWRKIINVSNFTVKRDKNNPLVIVIEKSKSKLDISGFIEKWGNLDNFKSKLTFKDIFESKYCSFITDKLKNFDCEKALIDELGFSNLIQKIIDAKKTIIGHNPFLDILFIYHNLIGDLPDDYNKFKEKVHFYFPSIIDTRYLVSRYQHIFEKRGIENILKKINDKKFDEYVEVLPDQKNGFCFYSSDNEKNFHDAGYDSYITGRIFIYLMKAIENNFEITNKVGSKAISSSIIIVEQRDVIIIKGFVDLEILDKHRMKNKVNFSIVSEVDHLHKNDICFNFNVEQKDTEEYIMSENIDFKNTFFILFKERCNIYDVAKIFTKDWNSNIVMADDKATFVQFMSNDLINLEEVKKLFLTENKDIEKIYSYQYFKNNFREFLKY